jgi:MFS transporter, DHA3 family, macrolide efflux protein
MSAHESGGLSARDVLRIRDFRLLWLGQIVSDFGDSLTMLALLIVVNKLTGSTAALATMAIVLALPQIVFGMIAGVFVDRWDRKLTMMRSDLLRGFMVLGFVLVNSADHVWVLYVIGFIQASIGTFFTPARSALIPALVPREGLLAANSLAQTSRVIAGVAGVSAAGFLIGALDISWSVFVIDSLTFFVSVLFIGGVKANTQARDKAVDSDYNIRAIFDDLFSGIKTIFMSRVLLGTLVGAGVTMLGLGAVNVLLVPLIVNDLRVPETWFGVLEFAQTASMVMSGGIIVFLAARFKPTRIISIGLLLMGILTILLALIGNVWHLLLILFGYGWVLTPVQSSIATLTQISVADELRGRIGAALNMMVATANVLSMAFAGVLGELIGIRNVFAVSGVLVVLAGLASAWVYAGASQRKAIAQAVPVGQVENQT